jgi:C_GCAxxG_C_C family probable redox protein
MAVPAEVQQSNEFKSICPSSADCMMLVLGNVTNKKAFDRYNQGFNCAQAVLSAYAEKLNLPENLALKMTSGLAAGIGFKGSVCGAVMGAYLAIGLKYGREHADDDLAKETTYLKMRDFDKEFIRHHNSLYCRDLLKGNVNVESELDEIIKQGYFEMACPVFVHTASNILKKIMN